MSMRFSNLWSAVVLACSGAIADACPISQTQYVVDHTAEAFADAAFVVRARVRTSKKIDPYTALVGLSVERVWKGDQAPDSFLNDLGSDCSQWLEVGTTYVLFARQPRKGRQMVIGLTGRQAETVEAKLLRHEREQAPR